MKDSPSALELAAIEGFRETFALLAARLKIDSDNDWLKLAQVHGHWPADVLRHSLLHRNVKFVHIYSIFSE